MMSIPNSHQIFFLSSSLEAMERILQNCVEKYSFHFVNGSFSGKFYQFAKLLKKSPLKYETKEGEGFHLANVRIPKNTELICITHNETSTGVSIPLQYVNKLKQNYKKLIALDIVSSAPYANMDFSLIDIAFFSVQKGFGLPAGLSVLLVNQKALEKANKLKNKGINIGSYHSFSSLADKNLIFQTPETPNVLLIYLLGKICGDMIKKGIGNIRKQTEKKADMIYNFFDKYQEGKPFVKDNNYRSKTTIAVELKGGSDKFIAALKKKGMIVSSGYGKFKKDQIRISNFPGHTIRDVKKLLALFP